MQMRSKGMINSRQTGQDCFWKNSLKTQPLYEQRRLSDDVWWWLCKVVDALPCLLQAAYDIRSHTGRGGLILSMRC